MYSEITIASDFEAERPARTPVVSFWLCTAILAFADGGEPDQFEVNVLVESETWEFSVTAFNQWARNNHYDVLHSEICRLSREEKAYFYNQIPCIYER